MAQTLRFPLPNMPFRRSLDNGCPVGTTISVDAVAYEDQQKTATVKLLTSVNNDVALRLTLPLRSNHPVKIDCVINGRPTTALEVPVEIPLGKPFLLVVRSQPHCFEINFGDLQIAQFVHRLNPELIRELHIDGPLMCDEVKIDKAEAPVALPPIADLPSYEQVAGATRPAMSRSEPLQGQNLPEKDKRYAQVPPQAMPVDISAQQASSSVRSGTSSQFAGGVQGFSNHPYPLPGLIDQNTYPSEPNPVHPLPQPAPIPPPVSSIPVGSSRITSSVPHTSSETQRPTTQATYSPVPVVYIGSRKAMKQLLRVTSPNSTYMQSPTGPPYPLPQPQQPVGAVMAGAGYRPGAQPMPQYPGAYPQYNMQPMGQPMVQQMVQPMVQPMMQPMVQPVIQPVAYPYGYQQPYYYQPAYYDYHCHGHHHHHHC